MRDTKRFLSVLSGRQNQRRSYPVNTENAPRTQSFVGMAYTTDLGRQMPYGAVINSKGVIIRVMTEKDYPEL
jgi:hypothetical protein